jgi:O-antigen ligase
MIEKISKFKIIDYFLLAIPILYVLGSPFINLCTLVFSLIFLLDSYDKKNWSWIKEKWVIFFLIFWVYNIINSFFATDNLNSIKSSFFYIRFLFFALCIYYLGFKHLSLKKVLIFWLIIISFISLDIYVQYFFGYDFFGYKAIHVPRYSGPFGSELVAGAYLSRLIPLICPMLLIYFFNFKFLNKFLIFGLTLTLFFSVMLTGERASFLFILAFLFLYVIFIFRNKISIIIKFSITVILITGILVNVPEVKKRYSDFYNIIQNFSESSYGKLYSSAFQLWKLNKITGVGFKNFRVNCDIEVIDNSNNNHQLCSTHPHNLYLEILSETGLIGLIIYGIFLFYLFKQIFRKFKVNKNYLSLFQISPILCMILLVWPILSAGSFYTTWNGSFFWLYLGLVLKFNEKNFLLKI